MEGVTMGGGGAERVPRRRYEPSERNLQVYEAVRVQGEVQASVAARLGLSQRRISQICQQVDRWRDSLRQRSEKERAEAERRFARQQLDQVYVRAIRELERSQKVVERRHGMKAGKPWSVETIRDQPADARWLRLALKTVERHAELDAMSRSSAAGDVPSDRVELLLAELAELLARGSSEGSSSSSEAPQEVLRAAGRKRLTGSDLGTNVAERKQPSKKPDCYYSYNVPALGSAQVSRPRRGSDRQDSCPD